MPANPVHWFEIYVADLPRAKHFYESVFQTELTELNSTSAQMLGFPMATEGYGAAGALVKMRGVPPGGNGTLVYFHCDDCAVELERAVKFGGRVHKDKTSIGEYGFIALVFDTESNLIGLHSRS